MVCSQNLPNSGYNAALIQPDCHLDEVASPNHANKFL